MVTARPSRRMRDIGIVQAGAPILATPARPFDLPTERLATQECVEHLFAVMQRVAQVHAFAKGMGLAAPQTGKGRAAAVVQPPGPGAEPIVLLNPRITAGSEQTDEQYEGCLSFFDVRGTVPRPLSITVESTDLDGRTAVTVYERGLARLVQHEVDHLAGKLYTSRMRTGAEPIPVEQYRQTGRPWTYDT
ncbi:MAG: peptide deformylase [Streptomycetaceae bacterium]|nr:peptide deformylase [Streptomycetaceae bacterium]